MVLYGNFLPIELIKTVWPYVRIGNAGYRFGHDYFDDENPDPLLLRWVKTATKFGLGFLFFSALKHVWQDAVFRTEIRRWLRDVRGIPQPQPPTLPEPLNIEILEIHVRALRRMLDRVAREPFLPQYAGPVENPLAGAFPRIPYVSPYQPGFATYGPVTYDWAGIPHAELILPPFRGFRTLPNNGWQSQMIGVFGDTQIILHLTPGSNYAHVGWAEGSLTANAAEIAAGLQRLGITTLEYEPSATGGQALARVRLFEKLARRFRSSGITLVNNSFYRLPVRPMKVPTNIFGLPPAGPPWAALQPGFTPPAFNPLTTVNQPPAAIPGVNAANYEAARATLEYYVTEATAQEAAVIGDAIRDRFGPDAYRRALEARMDYRTAQQGGTPPPRPPAALLGGPGGPTLPPDNPDSFLNFLRGRLRAAGVNAARFTEFVVLRVGGPLLQAYVVGGFLADVIERTSPDLQRERAERQARIDEQLAQQGLREIPGLANIHSPPGIGIVPMTPQEIRARQINYGGQIRGNTQTFAEAQAEEDNAGLRVGARAALNPRQNLVTLPVYQEQGMQQQQTRARLQSELQALTMAADRLISQRAIARQIVYLQALSNTQNTFQGGGGGPPGTRPRQFWLYRGEDRRMMEQGLRNLKAIFARNDVAASGKQSTAISTREPIMGPYPSVRYDEASAVMDVLRVGLGIVRDRTTSQV